LIIAVRVPSVAMSPVVPAGQGREQDAPGPGQAGDDVVQLPGRVVLAAAQAVEAGGGLAGCLRGQPADGSLRGGPLRFGVGEIGLAEN
jgi:hypothetical protein